MKAESLYDRVNRAKARWLKRVMYESNATSTQKCLAYAIADHLNCVTLDCWPGQLTLARLLGRTSERTPQRAGRGLAAHGLITIKGNPRGKSGFRYAPVFRPGDEDKPVGKDEQISPEMLDTDVRESSLRIQLRSSSTAAPPEGSKKRSAEGSVYRRSQRGSIELKLVALLGSRGLDILARLSSIDDAIVDRLCRAFAEGTLGDRELTAARLAADQVR